MRLFIKTFLILVIMPVVLYAEIPRFYVVSKSVIRGGQPTMISDFEYLKSLGIKTIINLRTTSVLIAQEKSLVESLGMNFRNYSINGMSYPDKNTVAAILADLKSEQLRPVFIHCNAGKDRTGLIIGLYRVLYHGWKAEDAYSEMLYFGFEPGLQGLNQFFWDHVR